jgi:type IV pilus assembly protein PilB
MHTLRDNIIDILLKGKNVTKEQLERALSLQKEKRVPLRRVLLEESIISEEMLLSLFSEQLYIPTLHLTKYKFDPAIVELIPERIARLYNLIPLSRMGDTLTVSMSDPLNIFALDDVKTITGCSIDTVLSPEEEIKKAIDVQYGKESRDAQKSAEDYAAEQAQSAEKAGVDILSQEEIELSSLVNAESDKAPIAQLVDLMLTQALKKRASDIHIEPERSALRIRYRIDGALHDVFDIPKINQNACLARLKIISNLDITESRIPQDGRFKVKFEGKEVDFRVSSLPTTFGP